MQEVKAPTIKPSQVVYDLTEVLLASTGKLRYYGIARVVEEIGRQLFKQGASVQFAVFSFGHCEFFEVFPDFIMPDGSVNLNVPTGIRQFRLRSIYHKKSVLRDFLLPPVRPVVSQINRMRWQNVASGIRPIDMSGKTLVSCARPKVILEMLYAMDRNEVPGELVPLLHDMIPIHDFKHRLAKFQPNFIGDNRLLISRSRALLANSNFTREELLDFSDKGILPSLPEVFVLPLAHECREGTEPAEQAPPEKPYILTVGSMLGRKNLDVVFEAMRLLKRHNKLVPTLVVAGALRKRTIAYVNSDECNTIRRHIVFRDNPNQADIVALYKNALALVLPSRMEGWGLPAGEALWCGTPVICSTAQVLTEVCGDLGLYFDPDKAEELVCHIIRLSDDCEFRNELRSRIAENKSKLRTWTDVATDLQNILETIGSTNAASVQS